MYDYVNMLIYQLYERERRVHLDFRFDIWYVAVQVIDNGTFKFVGFRLFLGCFR